MSTIARVTNTYFESESEFCTYFRCTGERKNMTIAHLNAQSCANMQKFDTIKQFMDDCGGKIDILILGETWFREAELCVFNLSGFKCIHSYRTNKRGGVLSIYVREPCSIADAVVTNSSFNAVQIELRNFIRFSRLSILGVYRPPDSSNLESFLKFLKTSLHRNYGMNTIVIGDTNLNVNANHDHQQRVHIDRYSDITKTAGLSICNGQITRNASGTNVDHFFSSMSDSREHDVHTVQCSHDLQCSTFVPRSKR